MAIGERLRKIRRKFDALSLREKAIIALTVSLLLVIIPYSYLYKPASARHKDARARADALRTELAPLEATVKVSEAKFKESPKPEKAPVISIPEANDLYGMYAELSGKASSLGIDFITISRLNVADRGVLQEMELAVEMRSSFRQLFDLLRHLNSKGKLFFVKSVEYETNDLAYPSGSARIRAVTYLKKK